MRNLPVLEARTTQASSIDTDIIAVYQEGGKAGSKKAITPQGAYGSWVERLARNDVFTGKPGSIQFVRFGGIGLAESGVFTGLGVASELTAEKVRSAGGHLWQKLKGEKSRTVAVQVDSFAAAQGLKPELNALQLIRALAEGLVLGAYSFEKYRSKEKGAAQPAAKEADYQGPNRISFVTADRALKQQLDRELAIVAASAEAIAVTRDWSNEPSNHGTPEYFANDARRLAKQYGLKCKILGEAEATREKMGLFIGVGQGSERDGRIVVVEYTPKKRGKSMKTIAFVGKGVTFDSGGISIKPSLRMEDMKHDMTGAATLMGALLLASKMQVPNRIVAVLAFTENMPSGNAIQPGNVLTSRAGKTVEIINTDAEGRLILADVLDYAQDFKPDAVIDAATLTGAVAIALGKYCCAVLGNDDALIEQVRKAGADNGERIWQLPLYDEYFDDLRSDCADMKNSANDGHGGTIRGAIFLKQYIRKGTRWAHLDIAATANNVTHLSYFPKKGASGAYVRTLAQFAADF